MLNGALARRYARALFELAVEMSLLDRVDSELREVVDLVDRSKELRTVLNHPNISFTTKKDVLESIFADSFSEITRHFIYLLVDRKRQNILSLVQREFSRLADEARQIVEAKVTYAASLTSDQEQELKQMLEKCTGKNIRLLKQVNPDLIGGAKLQIGDRVMDGSIVYALKKMRAELRKSSDKPQQEVGVS